MTLALDALKIDDWKRMIDVNICGVLHGIAATLPLLQQQRAQQIINMAAIDAQAVSPTAAVYCATRYAGWAIAEGSQQEVGGDIHWTVVAQGVTTSELADSISDRVGKAAMQAYRQIAIPPEAIARAVGFRDGAVCWRGRGRGRQRDHPTAHRKRILNSIRARQTSNCY